jgi:hypothetical protein
MIQPRETEINSQVDELLIVLDSQSEDIRRNLSVLERMRACMIKRDNTQLCRLLEQIQAEGEVQKNAQSKRQLLKERLSQLLGCGAEKVTLTKLMTVLTGPKRELVEQRRNQLRELIGQLKKEYQVTTLLLSEFSRFNELLLKALFKNNATSVVTYDVAGVTKADYETALVNRKV